MKGDRATAAMRTIAPHRRIRPRRFFPAFIPGWTLPHREPEAAFQGGPSDECEAA